MLRAVSPLPSDPNKADKRAGQKSQKDKDGVCGSLLELAVEAEAMPLFADMVAASAPLVVVVDVVVDVVVVGCCWCVRVVVLDGRAASAPLVVDDDVVGVGGGVGGWFCVGVSALSLLVLVGAAVAVAVAVAVDVAVVVAH
eukprot:3851296-Rhodomonas_salina.1